MSLTEKSGTISTLVKTERVYGPHVRQGFRVIWIYWDSAFRETGLAIGDVILGVDNAPYKDVSDGNVSANAVGQWGEPGYWEKAGKKDGDTVVLDIVRGDKEMQIIGELRDNRLYFTKDGKGSLFPGGPYRMANDGYQSGWSKWYEDLIKKESYILDAGWERDSFNNQRELEEHLGYKERMDDLLKKYPGLFAETLKKDWEIVRENLMGKKYAITEDDLEYRELGERRVRMAKQAAQAAWKNLFTELKEDIRETFPAPDIDNPGKDIGKVVNLPWIMPRQILNRLGRTFLIIGSNQDGFYFMDLETEIAIRFFICYYRFRALVNPNMKERYRFLVKILDEPIMLTYQNKPVVGLMVEPLAGMAGDEEMVMDLRDNQKDQFAGEAELKSLASVKLTDDMPPEKVVETMICAVQQADRETWQKVFADWNSWIRETGETYLNPSYYVGEAVFNSAWEASRRLVIKEVYDARVQKIGPVITLAEADAELKTPQIREVTIFIDHIGKVKNEYRAFKNINVHRGWTLQRLDNGPWRIMRVSGL